MAKNTLLPEAPRPDNSTEPDTGLNPLEKLGYNEATTPAERALEIEQAEADAGPSPQEQAKDELQQQAAEEIKKEAKGRWSQWKENFQQSRKRFQRDIGENKGAGQEAAGQTAKQAEKKVVQNIEEQAIKKVASNLERQVATKAATTAAVAAAPEIGIGVMIAIAVGALLLVILTIILFIYGLGSHDGGKGLAILPSTQDEKYAGVQLLAISGDPQAKAEVIIKEVADIKAKLESSKATAAKKLSGAKLAAFTTAIAETEALLDQLTAQAADSAHRNDTITQVNAKLKSLQDSYPEIFFSPGVCADLKEFIDNKKFIVLKPIPNRDLIVKGQMKNKAGQTWPASKDLCNSLVMALRAGYTITTGTLSFGHDKGTASGNISDHWCGAAIDIGFVNGKAVNGSNADAAALTKFWYDAGHSKQTFIKELIVPTPYRQYEMKDGVDHKYGAKIQDIHEDHIHLSGKVVDLRCKKR